MKTQFSVLMSLYDGVMPSHLRIALKSVFSQSWPPDEVIMMLDGPVSPQLQEVLREFRRASFRVIPLEKRGLAFALNKGLSLCSHDLIVRADSDDVNKPNRFETQVRFMISHPEIDCMSAWIDEFEQTTDNVKSIRTVPQTSEQIYSYGKMRCPMNHPCSIYRRHAVIKAGGYRNFPEDYYLWVSMLMAGCRLYNIQESLLFYRTDSRMFRRRGGLRYAIAEFKLHREFARMGYTGYVRFILGEMVRFPVRIMPNGIRRIIYRLLLRPTKGGDKSEL